MYKTREGRIIIYIYTAIAKKLTPHDLRSRDKKSVHIGSYVPSTKQCFIFYDMKKYVKNLSVK